MPAARTTLRRSLAAAAALPLLAVALAACGYGSEAKKDDTPLRPSRRTTSLAR